MSQLSNLPEVLRELRHVRQVRQFVPGEVSDEQLQEILQVARWTGSSRNSQPWHFVVVTDRESLRDLSQIRGAINWVAAAPVAVAVVLDGDNLPSEIYDEGRVTERLLIAAHLVGLGAGTAWFGDEAQQRRAEEILQVPAGKLSRSLVAIGRATTSKDPRPGPTTGGRRPLSDLVSYNRFGEHQR